jgi:hypothetical protein
MEHDMQSGKPRYMAGLWEDDTIAGLMWLPVPGRSDLPKPKTLNGREVMRAPSWSWMALVGPIEQGIYLGGEEEEPRCAPAVDNGNAWSRTPDGWGPEMVNYKKFSSKISLEIIAFIREVRVSKYRYIDYEEPGMYSSESNIMGYQHIGSTDRYSQSESTEEYVFLLEAMEDPPLIKPSQDSKLWDDVFSQSIAAEGLFDLDYDTHTPSNIWPMRVTNHNSLLLEYQSKTKTHKRIGVFRIRNKSVFYPKESINPNSKKVDEAEIKTHSGIVVIV